MIGHDPGCPEAVAFPIDVAAGGKNDGSRRFREFQTPGSEGNKVRGAAPFQVWEVAPSIHRQDAGAPAFWSGGLHAFTQAFTLGFFAIGLFIPAIILFGSTPPAAPAPGSPEGRRCRRRRKHGSPPLPRRRPA